MALTTEDDEQRMSDWFSHLFHFAIDRIWYVQTGPVLFVFYPKKWRQKIKSL